MSHAHTIVDVTDREGRIVFPDWLARAEAVHRELRPHLAADYVGTMRRVFSGGGRFSVAARDDRVVGVAVHRIYENTADGVHLYVDDLVTTETERSRGAGRALLDHMKALARDAGCASLTLDSGTQRRQAHKFYFREALVVTAFHFAMPLDA
jgi:GNAT superfamily N-acetyltransferase